MILITTIAFNISIFKFPFYQHKDTIMKIEYPSFLQEPLNDSTLYEALCFYDVPNPKIVLAQAKLESGNFTSRLTKNNNNPFGLYNSKTKQFYHFKHWAYAVLFYKENISNKYKGGNYFKFLEDLGYAEDPLYNDKLKEIRYG